MDIKFMGIKFSVIKGSHTQKCSVWRCLLYDLRKSVASVHCIHLVYHRLFVLSAAVVN